MEEADYERAALGLRLDRMAIEEVGASPELLARAIHHQLGERPGPVPVRAIAAALDIEEIRSEALRNMEGALIAPPERGRGSILVNSRSSPRRQRFTIGHELGHFLNLWHKPTNGNGFSCRAEDMRLEGPAGRRSLSSEQRQEIEANRFAIALLAPPDRLRSALAKTPDLTRPLALAKALDISREAACRRYVALHRLDLAVVFSRHGRVLYFSCGREFPGLSIGPGSPLPELPSTSPGQPLSEMEEIDSADWLRRPGHCELRAQTLRQQNGYAATLLWAEGVDDDDDGGIEDAHDRFSRFER